MTEVCPSCHDLQGEVTRLERMVDALMNRVERNMDLQGGSFSLFQAATGLQQRVLERTADLEKALDELKATNTQLVEAKEEADQANAAKSEFLANMSHELRTPLHSILSFAELGRQRGQVPGAERLSEYFGRIRDSGSTLLALLDDLLDLAKLEAGKMEFHRESCVLEGLLRRVTRELEALLLGRATLRWEVSSAEAVVDVDPHRMGQVVRNLIGNAIKFSPVGGTILLQQWVEGDAVKVAIEDEGRGIPDDEFELVFDKFVQSRRTKTGAGGTGLGLPICLEILKGHDGHVWVEEPRVLTGARVAFSLPLLGAPRPGDESDSTRPEGEGSDRDRVVTE